MINSYGSFCTALCIILRTVKKSRASTATNCTQVGTVRFTAPRFIFRLLRANFGNLRVIFENLLEILKDFASTSEKRVIANPTEYSLG